MSNSVSNTPPKHPIYGKNQPKTAEIPLFLKQNSSKLFQKPE